MANQYSQFHRVQISRAQQFIRENLLQGVRLSEVASVSGVSQFHFIRVFSAYTGETPFEYMQRIRILNSLELLASRKSILEISAEVGYETQSSYNKALKKLLGVSPTEFRNLGKEDQEKFRYSLSMNVRQKEQNMNLNLSAQPEVVFRSEKNIITLAGQGESFAELAPLVWQNFFELVKKCPQDLSRCEFLGLSQMASFEQIPKHAYSVAIAAPQGETIQIEGMTSGVLPAQKYLKFVLKGPYQGVWPAFDHIFRFVSENDYHLADLPCLENYLNDPNITPETELLTELLVPIKNS